MTGSALPLSPLAGQSLWLWFPLLLLLLPPPPVLLANPGESVPGRQPPPCPRGDRGPAPPSWLFFLLFLLSPPAGPASPFCSRCWGAGGGPLKTAGECGPCWGRGGGGYTVLWGKGQTGVPCQLWETGQLLSGPLTCSGPPAPQQRRCFLWGPLPEEASETMEGKAGWLVPFLQPQTFWGPIRIPRAGEVVLPWRGGPRQTRRLGFFPGGLNPFTEVPTGQMRKLRLRQARNSLELTQYKVGSGLEPWDLSFRHFASSSQGVTLAPSSPDPAPSELVSSTQRSWEVRSCKIPAPLAATMSAQYTK